jgi:hypothetical protein
MPFLPDSSFQSCLHETAEDKAEHHAPHVTPLPTTPPWENNPVQLLGRMKLPPSKTESHKQ